MANHFDTEKPFPSRSSKSKAREKGHFPRVLIKLVLIASILFVSGILIAMIVDAINQSDQQQVNSEIKNGAENNDNSNDSTDETTTNNDQNLDQNIDENKTIDKKEKTGEEQTDQPSNSESNSNEFTENGQWQPIGTKQEEPHITTFTKESIDWQEMVKAITYATNLSEEQMIIWRLENGGAPNLARGVVSTSMTKETPYEVKLEWVTNEGWKPVEVNVLDQNPYIKR